MKRSKLNKSTTYTKSNKSHQMFPYLQNGSGIASGLRRLLMIADCKIVPIVSNADDLPVRKQVNNYTAQINENINQLTLLDLPNDILDKIKDYLNYQDTINLSTLSTEYRETFLAEASLVKTICDSKNISTLHYYYIVFYIRMLYYYFKDVFDKDKDNALIKNGLSPLLRLNLGKGNFIDLI